MSGSLTSNSLVVVITIFILSLIGAYILFKVLRATAMIKNTKFQAGGALAGFIILYGTMFQSYQRLQNVKEIEGRLKEAKDEIGFLKTRMDASQRRIIGTVLYIAKACYNSPTTWCRMGTSCLFIADCWRKAVIVSEV